VKINREERPHANVRVDVAYSCRGGVAQRERVNVAPCRNVVCLRNATFGGCDCDNYDESDLYLASCTNDVSVNFGESNRSDAMFVTPSPPRPATASTTQTSTTTFNIIAPSPTTVLSSTTLLSTTTTTSTLMSAESESSEGLSTL
jgi:hypothetical protein